VAAEGPAAFTRLSYLAARSSKRRLVNSSAFSARLRQRSAYAFKKLASTAMPHFARPRPLKLRGLRKDYVGLWIKREPGGDLLRHFAPMGAVTDPSCKTSAHTEIAKRARLSRRWLCVLRSGNRSGTNPNNRDCHREGHTQGAENCQRECNKQIRLRSHLAHQHAVTPSSPQRAFARRPRLNEQTAPTA
jgi:hypothetical protein